MDVNQFKRLILEPTLGELHPEIPFSGVAYRLILETIWHESGGLKNIIQVPNDGPAYGICQMEKPTFEWLVESVLPNKPQLSLKFVKISATYPYIDFKELLWNLKLNVALCRLRYLVVPDALPEDNLEARAKYWFQFYNASEVQVRLHHFMIDAKELAL